MSKSPIFRELERSKGYSLAAVQKIIEQTPNCVSLKNVRQQTPLHAAASNGRGDACKALLKGKADYDARDKDGNRPLHLAALAGSVDAVKALLGPGARSAVKAKNNQNQTPLHFAVMAGSEPCAIQLLTAGARPDAKDKEQKTPMTLAKDAHMAGLVEALQAAASVSGSRATPLRASGLPRRSTQERLDKPNKPLAEPAAPAAGEPAEPERSASPVLSRLPTPTSPQGRSHPPSSEPTVPTSPTRTSAALGGAVLGDDDVVDGSHAEESTAPGTPRMAEPAQDTSLACTPSGPGTVNLSAHALSSPLLTPATMPNAGSRTNLIRHGSAAASLRDTLAAQGTAIAELKTGFAELREFAEAQGASKEGAHEHGANVEAVSALQAATAALEASLEGVRSDAALLRENTVTACHAMEESIVALEVAVATAEQNASNAATASTAANEALAATKTEIETRLSELASASQSQGTALADLARELKAQAAAAEQSVKDPNEAPEALGPSTKAAVELVPILESDLRFVRSRVAELQLAVDGQKSNEDALSPSALAEAAGKLQSELRAAVSNVSTRISETEARIVSLESRPNGQCTDDVASMRRSLEESTAACSSLSQELETMRRSQRAFESKLAEVAHLHDPTEWNVRRAEQEREMAEREKNLARLRELSLQQESERRALQETVDTFDSRLEKLQHLQEYLSDKVEVLEENVEDLHKGMHSPSARASTPQSARGSEVDVLRNLLRQKDMEIVQLQARCNTQEKDMDEMKSQVSELAAQMAALLRREPLS